MLSHLNEEEIRRELEEPKNREIIQAYRNSEYEKLNKAIYSPLIELHPSLEKIVKVYNDETDYVSSRNSLHFHINEFNELKTAIDSMRKTDAGEGDAILEVLNPILDQIDLVLNKYLEVGPIQDQEYIDFAYAVKSISSQKGIEVTETIDNLEYLNQALKLIIPTREVFETQFKMSQEFYKEMFNLGRDISKIKLNNQLDESARKIQDSIPTEEAIEALHKSVWDYKMREFDIIDSLSE